MGNALKALLAERHVYAYADFIVEYKRRASELDLPRGSIPPTKSQYYRWVGGQVRTLPRGDHCAVLERMFPGRTAESLFRDEDRVADEVPVPARTEPDFDVLASIIPAIEPAILEGLWVTGYLLGGTRKAHVDLSTVTATGTGIKSRNYPPAPRVEDGGFGHQTETSAKLYGRHLMGHFRNTNDHYFFGSLHLSVLPGENILDGVYTGFINDTQVMSEPWRWIRVDIESTAGVDLNAVTLREPTMVYAAIRGHTPLAGPIALGDVINETKPDSL